MQKWTLPIVTTMSFAVGWLVTASPAAVAQGAPASIWSGIYTKAQGERGAEVHSAVCSKCHGVRLNGAGWPDQPPSPAIAREGFLRRWDGKPISELATYIRDNMPADNPGGMTEQEIADAIAQMLLVSNVPPGDKELSTEGPASQAIIKPAP